MTTASMRNLIRIAESALIVNPPLFEGFARADLYHFTTLDNLEGILASDELRRGGHRGAYISLTRNAHWWGWNSSFTSRLTLDGDKIRELVARQGLRMSPIEEPRLGDIRSKVTKRGNIGEREERIYGEVLKNIRSALKVIDCIADGKEHDWQGDDYHLWMVLKLSHFQRMYHIPINYQGKPLINWTKMLDWAKDDQKFFWGGPYYPKYNEDGEKSGLTHSAAFQKFKDNLRV